MNHKLIFMRPHSMWILAVLLAVAGLGGCASVTPAPVPPAAACLLFDNDGNMDDLRALALLWPSRHVAAVVSTDGIVSARTGAATAARFLAGEPNVAVIQGRDRPAPSQASPSWSWLAQTRAEAERLPGLVLSAQAQPLAVTVPDPAALGAALAHALARCASVGAVVLGPWTSFVRYLPAIQDRLVFVVAQGRSPADTVDPGWGVVNCDFDRPACLQAVATLGVTPAFWVDLPASGPAFPITDDLVAALSNCGLAGRLKRAMQQDGQWRRQQMWDDGAALFLVEPSRFRLAGRHVEPLATPVELLRLEVHAINGSVP